MHHPGLSEDLHRPEMLGTASRPQAVAELLPTRMYGYAMRDLLAKECVIVAAG